MSDEPISYEKLMELYTAAYTGTFCPIIIADYSIAEDGVVNLFGPDGEWIGMTNGEGLEYLLTHATRIEDDSY